MRFRLTWDGPLVGASSRQSSNQKHKIRMHFHKQLKNLWSRHPGLTDLSNKRFPDYRTAVLGEHGGPFPNHQTNSYIDLVADHHTKFQYRWFPIVLQDNSLTCSVNIMLLRSGQIGHTLSLGDIDGRLKILFDAMCIPTSDSKLPNPSDPQSPIYVLLEDDRLISHVSVETDELLLPTGIEEKQNDSKIIATIDVKLTKPNWHSLIFAGQ